MDQTKANLTMLQGIVTATNRATAALWLGVAIARANGDRTAVAGQIDWVIETLVRIAPETPGSEISTKPVSDLLRAAQAMIGAHEEDDLTTAISRLLH